MNKRYKLIDAGLSVLASIISELFLFYMYFLNYECTCKNFIRTAEEKVVIAFQKHVIGVKKVVNSDEKHAIGEKKVTITRQKHVIT